MEIKDIIKFCEDNMCINCPFYDVSETIGPEGPFDTSECLFFSIPQQWNLNKIERRMKNYGKEKSTNRS